MQTDPRFAIGDVRNHYDRLSFFYHWLWGEHIHHGYWEDEESQAEAQLELIRRLSAKVTIPAGARVLDIGCGFGGSSLWLAREFGCSVLGITISPVQRRMAEKRAQRAGFAGQVRFEVCDANRLELAPESFDAIWIIECSEHLPDKADFLRRCASVLRPAGRLRSAPGWPPTESKSSDAKLVEEVCRGMLCPSLASMSEYMRWMRAAGLEQIACEDITRRVEKTWEICQEHPRRRWARMLLPFMDDSTRRFAASFRTIRRAYAEGAMAYGMFAALKCRREP